MVLPDGILEIKNNYFYDNKFENIVIPNSVTRIGARAFYSCTNLKSIEIPSSVTSIGDWAFGYCSSLTSIEIPNSITSIGDSAFAYCTNLNKVIIPDSVVSIGSGMFNSVYTAITIDLSQQTKLINLTGNLSLSSSYPYKILIPSHLLDQYKSASYWSNYASFMVGV